MESIFIAVVAWTMNDIDYKWRQESQSVQISMDVSTPTWSVLGSRVKNIEAKLESGKFFKFLLEIHTFEYKSSNGNKHILRLARENMS